MTYDAVSPTHSGWTPSGDYLLDWDLTGADGSATLTSGSGGSAVNVTVSTPSSSCGDAFTLSGGQLSAYSVEEPTKAIVTFDQAVTNLTFQLVDVDQGWIWDDKVTVLAYDADGNLVDVSFSHNSSVNTVSGNTVEGSSNVDGLTGSTADNVTVTVPGEITKLVIQYEDGASASSSGGIQITDMGFDLAAPDLDGVVEGSSGNDLIDDAYDGDPEGDMIDHGDAILPGESGDDDVVDAGAGDDTVLAGAGDDEIYAGSGADYVEGGAGDDVIYGDSSYSAETVREVFQWDLAPNYADERDAGSFTQDTGSVQVTFQVLSENCNADVEYEDNAGNISGIDTGTLGAADPNSGLALEGGGKYDDAKIGLNFSSEVTNVAFRINDIDMDSTVTVMAYDADGNPVAVTLSGGSSVALSDTDGVAGYDTASALGGDVAPTADSNSVLVEIAGPVASIRILHDIDGYDTSHIQLTDVYFDATGDGVDGDDTLLGGDGNDTIFGEGGNDHIDGGEGDDYLDGGDSTGGGYTTGDLIVNGSFEDTSGMTDTYYGYVATGSIVGWSTLDPTDEIDVHDDERGSVEPADGDNWADLDQTSGNISLYQDVTGAVAGESYTLTFSAGDKEGLDNNGVDVYWGGELIAHIDPPAGTMQEYSYTVTGGSGDGSDRLMFVGTGPSDSYGTSIDAVSLVGAIEGTGGLDTGADTIIGGAGDDVILGRGGDDLLTGGDGSDSVYGGEGNDVIDTSGSNPMSDYGFPPYVPQDDDIYDDRDYVDGGDGDDTITTGDDQDTIFGGAGSDSIDGGLDDDMIDGGSGDDSIIGGHGSDLIQGGDGNDTIWGGLGADTDPYNIPDEIDPVTNNAMDEIHGGAGDDVIYGQDDDDLIYGDAGNDYIDGGIDDDEIYGGDGDDTLLGGDGDDTIYAGDGHDSVNGGAGEDEIHGGGDNDYLVGGADADTFIIDTLGSNGVNNTTVDGSWEGDDNDTLDFTALIDAGWEVKHHVQNPETNGNPGYNGQVQLYNQDLDQWANINYFDIEHIVPCFTPGTLIATPKGEMRVEDLKAGDRVITRDNGIQEIRWIGEKRMDWKALQANKHLRPVLIQAGSLGNGLPERDMMVSPNHRILVANDRTALYFDEREVLAAAKHLVDNKGITTVDPMAVSYIHFMFDHHEVVLSDGAWTESFQPGDYSLKGLGNAQRRELFELFPELETREGLEDYTAARRILKKHEARMLVG